MGEEWPVLCPFLRQHQLVLLPQLPHLAVTQAPVEPQAVQVMRAHAADQLSTVTSVRSSSPGAAGSRLSVCSPLSRAAPGTLPTLNLGTLRGDASWCGQNHANSGTNQR